MVAAASRPHPEVDRFLAELRERRIPPISTNPLPRARRQYDALLRQAGHQAADHGGVEVTELELSGPGDAALRCRSYRAAGAAAGAVVVYLHGGGWALGSLDGYDGLCRAIAAGAGCELVAVDYRQPPEHVYPAALEDALAALAWAAASRPGRPLVLAGDSAGGNLAAAAALAARDRGGPAVDLQVLLCPIVIDDDGAPSRTEFASGYVLEGADIEWFWDLYCPEPERRREAGASPLRAAHLAGLPPALVVLAELDPLRDDAHAYAERLRESGVTVDLRTYAGMTHGFPCYPGLFTVAGEALETVNAAIAAVKEVVQ